MKKVLFFALLFLWLLALKAFAQPIQEIDPRSIWKDGSKTTTGQIPFALGASIAAGQPIQFGSSSDTYISNLIPGYLDITAGATNPILRLNGTTAVTGGVEIYTIAGQTIYDAAGSISHIVPNSSYWAVTDRNEDPQFQVFANTAIASASATSYAPFTANSTMTAQSTVTLNAQTANRLLYANATKVVNSATVSAPLTFTTGTLAFDQTANFTWSGTHQWDNTGVFDLTNAAAFTVRRDASGGNIFTVDTTNYQSIFGANTVNATSIGTCTISNASPAVVTKASHGLSVGDRVFFTTTVAVPSPLHPDGVLDGVWEYYYIISAGFSANSFEISLTAGGAAINTTTAGSGTHTLWKYTPNQQVIDSTRDVLAEWRNSKGATGAFDTWVYGIRDSADEWFTYPGYAPRFLVDVTINSDYNPAVAFTAYIKAGINASEAYGFWGGVYDTGTTGKNYTGDSIGVLAYNYFSATNARTIASPKGGQFTNEFGTNVSGTTATGGQFNACIGGAPTYTNFIGVDVGGPAGGTVTNNYGVKVASSSVGTNNFGVWLQTNQNLTFRAGTQAIWSSAASTLDFTTNTTFNFKTGANPSNGTAGTLVATLTATTLDFKSLIADMTAGKAEMPAGTALPATCTQGEYFQDTDSNDCANTGGGDGAVCVCKTANTWALVANI